MITVGCCAPLEAADAVRDAGFAYLEANIGQLCTMEEAAFEEACAKLKALHLPVSAGNCFLPGDWPLCHAERDPEKDRAYLKTVADRLSRLGCKMAVLGSGGPRSVREDYGLEKGKRQFLEFYRLALAILGEKGITVAIEPLRRAECSWLNSVGECLELIRNLPEKNRGVICDFYHLAQENEPPEILERAAPLLRHCHIAHPVTRKAPVPEDGFDYTRYTGLLKKLNYHGLLSFEGDWENDPGLLRRCCEHLQRAAR